MLRQDERRSALLERAERIESLGGSRADSAPQLSSWDADEAHAAASAGAAAAAAIAAAAPSAAPPADAPAPLPADTSPAGACSQGDSRQRAKSILAG